MVITVFGYSLFLTWGGVSTRPTHKVWALPIFR
jgi:hypothetical protein